MFPSKSQDRCCIPVVELRELLKQTGVLPQWGISSWSFIANGAQNGTGFCRNFLPVGLKLAPDTFDSRANRRWRGLQSRQAAGRNSNGPPASVSPILPLVAERYRPFEVKKNVSHVFTDN